MKPTKEEIKTAKGYAEETFGTHSKYIGYEVGDGCLLVYCTDKGHTEKYILNIGHVPVTFIYTEIQKAEPYENF